MNLINDMGVILNRRVHLDADVRVTLFAENHGKLMATVKSGQKAKSKIRALLEPFTVCDFQLYLKPHATHARLISGKLKSAHPRLRQNVNAFSTAAMCTELIDALFPFRAPHPEAFPLLTEALRSLEQTEAGNWVWISFVTHLLDELGHGNHTDHLLNRLEPSEKDRVEAFLSVPLSEGFCPPQISTTSQWRLNSHINDRLGDLLPRPLKSASFKIGPTPGFPSAPGEEALIKS